ncbi:hypothetical protein T31B1_10773 [Salinisphaera sp. T31B1]
MIVLAGLPLTGVQAHGGDTAGGQAEVRAVLDELPPALSDLRVQLRHTLAAQLLVYNPTDRLLVVEDARGRPFLRIGAQRVQADLGAAAFHRTNTLMAPGAIDADASSRPDWQVVESTPSWGWFDLRLRSDSIAVPHHVVDGGQPRSVARWSIPVRYGSQRSAIRGHFEYVPPARGMIEARVIDAGLLDGQAVVRAMTGSARPGLFVSYRGTEPLIVLDADGAPFLRFSETGVDANRASATWARVRPSGAPAATPDSTPAVAWARVSSTGSYGWIEPRAAADAPAHDGHDLAVVKRWRIPVRIGTMDSSISGQTEWAPIAPAAASHH